MKNKLGDGNAAAVLASIRRCTSDRTHAKYSEVREDLKTRGAHVRLLSLRVYMQRLKHRKLLSVSHRTIDRQTYANFRLTAKGRKLLKQWDSLMEECLNEI
jgi:repressor of nif and glnA expression